MSILRLTRNFSTLLKKASVRPSKKDVMTVTPRAATRLEEIFSSQDVRPKAIKIGVRTRGCNGFTYTMNFAEEPAKFDEVVQVPEHDIKVIVDSKALLHVIGTTMDWVDTDLASEFTFNNPNSKGTCGCGESFTV